MDDSQAAWLESVLKAEGKGPSILVTHHHLLPEQGQIPPLPESRRLLSLLEHSGVSCILCGHTHHHHAGLAAGRPCHIADSLSFCGDDMGGGQVRFQEKYGFNFLQDGRGDGQDVQKRNLCKWPDPGHPDVLKYVRVRFFYFREVKEMGFVLDTHTHTIASAHAYSTVAEMAKAAGDRGLGLLAVTDHGPALADSSHKLHFMNYHVLPKEMRGVRMLYGAELNILDFEGNVDLDEDILKRQDICIASFHTACTKAGTMEENTQAYLKAMENPYVNIIGHPEDGYVPVDFERLVKKGKGAEGPA